MARMPAPKILAIVLAGGAGSRLELLTRHRAKPAVPVAGSHRLIDVALSNCAHADIDDVWVIQQQHPASLADALRNGRPWDLDRTRGGLLILPPGPPTQGTDRDGWHEGTADALWKNAPLIEEFAADVVVVLSADAVYRMDYSEVADHHVASGASVTMVTTTVDDQPERYGVVQTRAGAITDYAYKPDEPNGNLISNEVFAFDPGRLLGLLEELAEEAGAAGEALSDLGDALLPRMVEAGEAREYRYTDYWRDLGTVEAYWSAHMEFLPPRPAFDFLDPSWPIVSSHEARDAARILRGAQIADALVDGGAEVAGSVERSVIGRDAVIEKGAVVRNAVILPGARVRAGAEVRRAVVDSGATIGRDCRIGSVRGRIALVGHGATVRKGTTIGAGGRYPDVQS